MNCQDCGTLLPTDQTIRGIDVDARTHTCACGSRFMSEQRIVRRLMPVQPRPNTHKATPNRGNAPPREGANPLSSGGGVGGGLPEISPQPLSKQDPNPTSGFLSNPDPDQTRARRNRRTTVIETPAFVEFYTLYPRKKQRDDAAKAWQDKGCESTAAAVIAGLRSQLPALRARPLDKVPYPASYLRAGEWKDAPEAVPSAGSSRSDGNVQNLSDWLDRSAG